MGKMYTVQPFVGNPKQAIAWMWLGFRICCNPFWFHGWVIKRGAEFSNLVDGAWMQRNELKLAKWSNQPKRVLASLSWAILPTTGLAISGCESLVTSLPARSSHHRSRRAWAPRWSSRSGGSRGRRRPRRTGWRETWIWKCHLAKC